MIALENLTKVANVFGKRRPILSATNLQIPTDRRIAVVGSSMADNLLFINMLAGMIMPTTGKIIRRARVSYPVGYFGGFDLELPVRSNVAHAARLYGSDVKSVVEMVRTTADIGAAFDRPMGLLPRVQRREVAEIITYSIPFDVYLLTADIARVQRQRRNGLKGLDLLDARAQTCGVIAPARDFKSALGFCDMGLMLHHGRLQLFEDLQQASRVFELEQIDAG